MPPFPSVWKRLATDPWLSLLVVSSIIGITLAYQRSEPYHVALDSRRDDYLIEGFHDPERNAAGPFRWTEARADVRFPNLWPSQPVRLSLTLNAPRPDTKAAVPVTVTVNGQLLAALTVGAYAKRHDFDLDAATLGASGNVYLTLQSPTFTPPNDTRQLGVVVSAVDVMPTGRPPFAPSLPILVTLTALVALSYIWLRLLSNVHGVEAQRSSALVSADSTLPAKASTPVAFFRDYVPFIVGLALVSLITLGLVVARPLVTQVNARVLYTLVVAFVASEVTVWLGRYGANVRAHRLTALLFLGAFAARMILAHTPGDHDNLFVFKAMLEQGTRFGLANVYGLDPVYGAYPPFYHYHLTFVGWLYRAFMSPELYVDSLRLNFLMKMPTITYDMLITLVVMVYAARQRDARCALLVGATYAFNPGIIYTTAYNGQLGDPFYAAFVTIAVVALLSQRATTLGLATALAVLTKPQAAAFAPFLALGALWHLSPRGDSVWKPVARTILASALTVAVISAPFALAGTLPQMINTLSQTIGHGPRIASNAFNIWWLYGWGHAWEITDGALLLGLVSYRAIGLVSFFLVAYGFVAWRVWRARAARRLALLAGFVGLAFFMLPTEIHENYLFPTFPLLALWAVRDRRAWSIMAVLTLTWFVNLVTTDPTLMEPLAAAWPPLDALLFPAQAAMAALNVGALCVWTWWALRD
ncbi:MAG: hypothetical protein ABI874_12330 [Chloroflexota bacterium]